MNEHHIFIDKKYVNKSISTNFFSEILYIQGNFLQKKPVNKNQDPEPETVHDYHRKVELLLLVGWFHHQRRL
jgi:hypothetical protein